MILQGDCLDIMPTLPAQSVGAIIADIPYGTTACKWDTVIPFEPMWRELKRIIKPRGVIVLFGSQPFTSALVMSNPSWFRYEWVWDKRRVTGWLDCHKKPLKAHESIAVFASGSHAYNPQMVPSALHTRGPRARPSRPNETYAALVDGPERAYESGEMYPRSIVTARAVLVPSHPNEKPVELMSYLVKTYTDPGDTVLDFTMGVGSTGVACVETGREFIGIEQDRGYFDIATERIAQAEFKRSPAAVPLFTQAGLDLG
jgi:hypothetical protein